MDYSKYRTEEAAQLRQHDERIQLLREQREIGQQILKEMDERNSLRASLDGTYQRPTDEQTSDQQAPSIRAAYASPNSTTIQPRDAPRQRDADRSNTSVASGPSSRTQKRRRASGSPYSTDTEYRPAQRSKPRGDPASKRYPLFRSDENYLSIVKIDNRVVEVACHVCGGNYFRPYNGGWKFLPGVQGVQKHIHMSHPQEHERIRLTRRPFFEWVAEHCVRHILSEEEKEDVRQGRYVVQQRRIRTINDIVFDSVDQEDE